jgi:hypothetical protein
MVRNTSLGANSRPAIHKMKCIKHIGSLKVSEDPAIRPHPSYPAASRALTIFIHVTAQFPDQNPM